MNIITNDIRNKCSLTINYYIQEQINFNGFFSGPDKVILSVGNIVTKCYESIIDNCGLQYIIYEVN